MDGIADLQELQQTGVQGIADIGRTPIENWIGHMQGLPASRRHGQFIGSTFNPNDRVSLRDAAEQIGYRRVNYELLDVAIGLRGEDGKFNPDELIHVPRRFAVVPTIDGTRKYRERSTVWVSDRYEYVPILETLDAIQPMLMGADGKPLPVTALAASDDLYKCIVQVDLGEEAFLSHDMHGRFLTLVIGVTGMIMSVFFKSRIACRNQMPAIRELASGSSMLAVRHVKGANAKTTEGVGYLLVAANTSQARITEAYRVFSQVAITPAQAEEWYEQMYNPGDEPRRDDVMTRNGRIITRSFEDRYAEWMRAALAAESKKRMALRYFNDAANDTGRCTVYEFLQGATGAASHFPTARYETYALDAIMPNGKRVKEHVEQAYNIAKEYARTKGFKFSFSAN